MLQRNVRSEESLDLAFLGAQDNEESKRGVLLLSFMSISEKISRWLSSYTPKWVSLFPKDIVLVEICRKGKLL